MLSQLIAGMASRAPNQRDLDLALIAASNAPAVLSPAGLAKVLGLSVKTVYFWLEAGRFHGAARKRGKHWRIVRDRAIELFFFGPDWKPTK